MSLGFKPFSRRWGLFDDDTNRLLRKYFTGGPTKVKTDTTSNRYNEKDVGYDYSNGIYDDESGHWSSRNPENGILTKHPNHPTYNLALEDEYEAGMRRFVDYKTGREYTFDNNEIKMGKANGMKEVGYPSDLYHKSTYGLYGEKLPVAIKYYNHLIGLGANDVQAAAIVGVLMQESGLNHNAESEKGAVGVAQLLGDKYKKYNQWLRHNNKPDTAENQIDGIWDHMSSAKDDWHEYYMSLYNHSLDNFDKLKGDELTKAKHDGEKMKDSKGVDYGYEAFRNTFYDLSDAGDAAELFTWTFERPGEKEANIEKRRRLANYLLKYMRYPNSKEKEGILKDMRYINSKNE